MLNVGNKRRGEIKDDTVLAWAAHFHLRWEDWKREKEVKAYILDVLHLTEIQVELLDRYLLCINESGAEGRGQSYT